MSPLLILLVYLACARSDYWEQREKFIQNDEGYCIGADIELNEREKQVNDILMNAKLKELDDGFKNPENFLPAQHFFEARPKIEKSAVFQLIQKLPKGASLHSHDFASISLNALLNLTYIPHLYACQSATELLRLQFFQVPDNSSCSEKWQLLQDLRKENPNYDDWLVQQLSLITKDYNKLYPDINTVWEKFIKLFVRIFKMVNYRPALQKYIHQILQEFYDDNVMYVELRGTLPEVYELNGTVYSQVESLRFYQEVSDAFVQTHENFMGMKFIFAPSRKVHNTTMDEYIRVAKKLKEIYPNFLVGFDLVGQEDVGTPLEDFVNDLMIVEKEMKLFFHAGETNWSGSLTDLNLIDAVMLGTSRIGHGYALIKHPEVLKIVKQQQIAIEVSPISNQVLKLVGDIRNHPANMLIAFGYPVVICCDDPTFWGAKALSYDWYMAFMGMTSRTTDLKFLKQIAINSIKYSALSSDEKSAAHKIWKTQWSTVLSDILATNTNNVK